MITLHAYDPHVAANLAWLAGHGVRVTRYNLAQEPGAFVAKANVISA